jgi:hypothetical protein
MEDSVKLTDAQRRLLAAASQRDDGALKRPLRLTGDVAGKAVAKLLAEGLIEGAVTDGSYTGWLSAEGRSPAVSGAAAAFRPRSAK